MDISDFPYRMEKTSEFILEENFRHGVRPKRFFSAQRVGLADTGLGRYGIAQVCSHPAMPPYCLFSFEESLGLAARPRVVEKFVPIEQALGLFEAHTGLSLGEVPIYLSSGQIATYCNGRRSSRQESTAAGLVVGRQYIFSYTPFGIPGIEPKVVYTAQVGGGLQPEPVLASPSGRGGFAFRHLPVDLQEMVIEQNLKEDALTDATVDSAMPRPRG